MASLEIEKQFKNDFGMSLHEATKLSAQRKKDSYNSYYQKVFDAGLDLLTGEKSHVNNE